VREVRVHWDGGDAAQIQPKKVGTIVKNTGKREREKERAREGGREEQRSGDRR